MLRIFFLVLWAMRDLPLQGANFSSRFQRDKKNPFKSSRKQSSLLAIALVRQAFS